jgi:NAD(P)-dependent dehydrogenase (short-subunit alcohol dehydrogenase family)
MIKAALECFTQGLAQEVHKYGIAVTRYAPSQVVATPARDTTRSIPAFMTPAANLWHSWHRPPCYSPLFPLPR